MLTVQHNVSGKWHNLLGHGCVTETEMREYVRTLDKTGDTLRVADVSAEGEDAPPVKNFWEERRTQFARIGSTPEGRAALTAVLDALKDD